MTGRVAGNEGVCKGTMTYERLENCLLDRSLTAGVIWMCQGHEEPYPLVNQEFGRR